MTELRRRTDDGWLCVVAQRAREFWDWVDRRQIDAYAVSIGIFYGTVKITEWAMAYASSHAGEGVALIIAAVTAPYMAMQAAALKFYFDARQRSFLPGDKQ